MAKRKRNTDDDIVDTNWKEVRDDDPVEDDEPDVDDDDSDDKGDDSDDVDDDLDDVDDDLDDVDDDSDDADDDSDDAGDDSDDAGDDSDDAGDGKKKKKKSARKSAVRKRSRRKSTDDDGDDDADEKSSEDEPEAAEQEEEDVEPEPDHQDAVASLKDLGVRLDLNKWESVWRMILYEDHDDAVLEQIHGLPCLKEIWLLGTKVSTEGHEALKERMPELTIYYA